MRVSSKAAVHIHCHAVELLQGRHCLEKKNHTTTTFDSLNGAGKQVGSHGLKILKNKHSIRVPQNGVSFIVVTVTYLRRCDKELKRVILNSFDVDLASLRLFFEFLHALLFVRTEAELFFVTPQDGWTGFDSGFGHDVVQIDNLLPAFVADDDEK